MKEWKEQLAKYEEVKDWDAALKLTQKVIEDDPDNIDVYLLTNYLLMNLLVEEDYEFAKTDYYSGLLKRYFNESYVKFSQEPEYLFYTAITASMSEWFMGINDKKVYYKMFQRALEIRHDNALYLWGNYAYLPLKNVSKAVYYAKIILNNDLIKLSLCDKGALGGYVVEMIKATIKYEL